MKKRKIKIAPSMMCADFVHLKSELDLFGLHAVDYLHIDVMDGHYVPNITIGYDFARSLTEYIGIPLDFHLMVERPENFTNIFCQMENSIVTIHPETTWHPDRLLRQIRDSGCRPGIAIDPYLPVDHFRHLYPIVDLVLVMTVNPGYAGQEMIPHGLNKVRELSDYVRSYELDLEIEVDGNVSWDNIPHMIRAGATQLVAGTSSLFDPDLTREDAMKKLADLISNP